MMSDFNKLPSLANCKIAVVGLGYVGLPLAVQFALVKICQSSNQKLDRKVYGFDIKEERINALKTHTDFNNECSRLTLESCSDSIVYTSQLDDLINCEVFIVTVPTPVDQANIPDLSILKNAIASIGSIISDRKVTHDSCLPVIIIESTVYPGASREIAQNELDNTFSLTLNEDYFLGFSPERINPGDKAKTISDVVKVTSGSNQIASKWIDNLYGSIISAGTHLASSIEVAEAAKIIENTQRDLNIALMNELSIIFDRLNIDTREVLAAASTKWNFIPFSPGLVGGHCIGVDPYYLTHKAVLRAIARRSCLLGEESTMIWLPGGKQIY